MLLKIILHYMKNDRIKMLPRWDRKLLNCPFAPSYHARFYQSFILSFTIKVCSDRVGNHFQNSTKKNGIKLRKFEFLKVALNSLTTNFNKFVSHHPGANNTDPTWANATSILSWFRLSASILQQQFIKQLNLR